jgi:hypothetical protein
MENREGERHSIGVPIVYAFKNTDKFFGGELCNYSRGGLCFESSYPIRPGAEIYIMMDEKPIDDDRNEIFGECLAEVRWCRKLPDVDAFFYWIGVKYRRSAKFDESF